MDAGDAEAPQVFEEQTHVAEGIDAVDSSDHWRFLDLGQHLATQRLVNQLVGIGNGQHAGQGAIALHAEVAGVVDADDVYPAALDKLGGDAIARAGHDQGPAVLDLSAEAGEELLARVVTSHGMLRHETNHAGRDSRSSTLRVMRSTAGSWPCRPRTHS